MVRESKIKYKNIDVHELARYVAVSVDEEIIRERGLCEVVMKRKCKGGRKPRVTGAEMRKGWISEASVWTCPERVANDDEVKMMLALALSSDVDHLMRNNFFKFEDVLYKQSEGGMTGSELICVLAKTRMIIFIRILKRRAENIGLLLIVSKVYVDDTVIIAKRVRKGTILDEHGGLTWCEQKAVQQMSMESDVVTAEFVCGLANTLEGDIIMTYDSPSQNLGGKMPVLDLKVWMDCEFKVKFQFYQKSMAAKLTVMRASALSWTSKKVILANELARRMFNTSPDLVEKGEAENDIDEFLYKLMRSGYSVKERRQIEFEGTRQYRNVVSRVEAGERKLYRSANEAKLVRAVGKKVKECKWWGKAHDTVMFVQATPNELLRKKVQEVCDREGMKVKVVEKGGRNLKQILQRSEVASSGFCGRTDCRLCEYEGKGMCSKESVGYKIWCPNCEEEGTPSTMHGETGRCARVRINEHFEALEKGRSSNLQEHCDSYHNGQKIQFRCEVVRAFRDPLTRQLEEALRIRCEPGVLMNDKNEWTRPAGYSLTVQRM